MTARHTASLVSTVLACALGTSAAPAAADPYAGWVSTATASVRILGSDRVLYQLELTAQGSAAPHEGIGGGMTKAGMLLSVTACKGGGACAGGKRYSTPVAGSAFTVAEDASSGSLIVPFGKTHLRVSWSGPGSMSLVSDMPGTGARVGRGGAADVTFSLNKATCRASGRITRVLYVDSEQFTEAGGGATPIGPFAQFAPRGKTKPTCL